jgi:hypothetical protein
LYAAETARAERIESDVSPAWQRMRQRKSTTWLKD